MFNSILLSLALLSGVSHAGEAEAWSCLKAKVWDSYKGNWAVRFSSTSTLGEGEHRIFLVTLYEGNQYRIISCADHSAKNVDVLLYDDAGNVIQQDESVSRNPEIVFKPPSTTTYYVVIHARSLTSPEAKSEIGMAVLYK